MNELRRLAIVVGLLFTAAAWSGVERNDDLLPYVTGRAMHQQSGQYLYSENHFCDTDRVRCRVAYRNPDGVLLAEKAVDYSSSLNTPTVELREPADSAPESLAATDAQVVDAGFDHFVRSRWELLAAGEAVSFDFQALGFDRAFNMRAQTYVSADCEEVWLCLRVQLSSWLLRLVAQPIELAYHRDSRQLLRYRGITNLRSAELRSQSVEIRYTYTAQ